MHSVNDQNGVAARTRRLHAVRSSVAAAVSIALGRAGYVGLLALGAGLAPAFADDAADAGSLGLEEVTVSATRRETSLLKTPMAISAVTAESLVTSGVSSMQDIAVLVPTMRMEGGRDGGGRMTMRGIRAPGGEATVGLYYGDVPMFGPSDTSQTSGSFTQEANLFDVERIEALRGPQGTLYGASSMGGAMRVLFNKASTTKTEGVLDGSVSTIRNGDFSTWIKGAYNLPLIDNVLGIRVAAWKEDRGGYVDDAWSNRTTGTPQALSKVVKNQENINTGSILGARVMMTWTPADFLSWNGMAMYQEIGAGERQLGHEVSQRRAAGRPADAGRLQDLRAGHRPGGGRLRAVLERPEGQDRHRRRELGVLVLQVGPHHRQRLQLHLSAQRDERERCVASGWRPGAARLIYSPPPVATSVPACTTAQLAEYTNYSRTMLQPAALVKPNWVTIVRQRAAHRLERRRPGGLAGRRVSRGAQGPRRQHDRPGDLRRWPDR